MNSAVVSSVDVNFAAVDDASQRPEYATLDVSAAAAANGNATHADAQGTAVPDDGFAAVNPAAVDYIDVKPADENDALQSDGDHATASAAAGDHVARAKEQGTAVTSFQDSWSLCELLRFSSCMYIVTASFQGP